MPMHCTSKLEAQFLSLIGLMHSAVACLREGKLYN